VLSLLVYAFFLIDGIFLHQKINSQSLVLSGQTKIEESYKALTGYNKLQAVKLLEDQQTEIPRSDHINAIIKMLEDIKNVQTSGTIILSDFKVDTDTLSLKGEVSALPILYASDPTKGVVSLLDRFSQLDFIKDIRIQTYDKVGDSGYFQFVLEANIINDGGTQ